MFIFIHNCVKFFKIIFLVKKTYAMEEGVQDLEILSIIGFDGISLYFFKSKPKK